MMHHHKLMMHHYKLTHTHMQHHKLTHLHMQDQKVTEALKAYHHQTTFLDALVRYVDVVLDTTSPDLPPPPQLTPAPVVEWDEDDFVARLQRHFADIEAQQHTPHHKLHHTQAVHEQHDNASAQVHEDASLTHKDTSRDARHAKDHAKGDAKGDATGDANANGRYSNEMGAPEVQAYRPVYACVCENSVCAVCVCVCLLFVFVVCWRL